MLRRLVGLVGLVGLIRLAGAARVGGGRSGDGPRLRKAGGGAVAARAPDLARRVDRSVASRRHRLRALIGFAGGVRGTPALQGRPRVPEAAHVGAVGVRGMGVRERRRVRRAREGAGRRQGREREVATMHGDAGPWG